jgi:hypothetical protein
MIFARDVDNAGHCFKAVSIAVSTLESVEKG